MKKLTIFALVLSLLLLLAACGDGDPDMKKDAATGETVSMEEIHLTQEGHNHHHGYHIDLALSPEEAGKTEDITLYIFSRTGNQRYIPVASQAVTLEEQTVCTSWDGHILLTPEGQAVAVLPNPEGQLQVEAVLYAGDDISKERPCVITLGMEEGELALLSCWDANTREAVDIKAYVRAEYPLHDLTPVWDEAGPLMTPDAWEQGEARFLEDDLTDGISLRLGEPEQWEGFYSFVVSLTDGTAYATELKPLVSH